MESEQFIKIFDNKMRHGKRKKLSAIQDYFVITHDRRREIGDQELMPYWNYKVRK